MADKKTFYMRTSQARESAIAMIRNLPLDNDKPMQVTVEAFRPVRKLSQNALMWVGPLKDIAEQAWLNGRQFSDEVWHHHFKEQFLPEEFDPELCKDGYVKWDYDPAGNRVLVGSTTQLTVKGMAQYMEQVFAFGGNLGVQFSERPLA